MCSSGEQYDSPRTCRAKFLHNTSMYFRAQLTSHWPRWSKQSVLHYCAVVQYFCMVLMKSTTTFCLCVRLHCWLVLLLLMYTHLRLDSRWTEVYIFTFRVAINWTLLQLFLQLAYGCWKWCWKNCLAGQRTMLFLLFTPQLHKHFVTVWKHRTLMGMQTVAVLSAVPVFV